jgi:hypothetical protein
MLAASRWQSHIDSITRHKDSITQHEDSITRHIIPLTVSDAEHHKAQGQHRRTEGQYHTTHRSIGYAVLAWGEQSHRTTSSVMWPVLVGSVVATLTELYTEDW